MAEIDIYTRDGCPFCTAAKALLDRKKAPYREINATGNAELRREMNERSGRNTFPQIFIGATHVGGCDDLHDLDRRGGLDPLLAG